MTLLENHPLICFALLILLTFALSWSAYLLGYDKGYDDGAVDGYAEGQQDAYARDHS